LSCRWQQCLSVGLFQLDESTMDKVPCARINPRTFVKDPIDGRSADASSLRDLVDSGSGFRPHYYKTNRPRGSRNRIIVPQQDSFKRLFSELIQGKP
jgi:hypothetical protein